MTIAQNILQPHRRIDVQKCTTKIIYNMVHKNSPFHFFYLLLHNTLLYHDNTVVIRKYSGLDNYVVAEYD